MRFAYQLAGGLFLGAVSLVWFTAFPPLESLAVLRPQPEDQSDGGSTANKTDTISNSAIAIPEYLLVDKSIKTIMERIRSRRTDQQLLFTNDLMLEQARRQETLFTPGVSPENAAKSPLANAQRLKDNRIWFSYDMLVLGARAEGDKFVLQIPDMGTVQAEIERVDKVHGQYRWSGQIVNQPGSQFFITQVFSDQYAIGHITTAQGQYQLESKAGTGWIANSNLEFRLPPDGQDGLIPADSAHKH